MSDVTIAVLSYALLAPWKLRNVLGAGAGLALGCLIRWGA